jgi:hypothetical protein
VSVIQVGATQTDGANADDNVTFNKPVGVQSGDLLIACVNFVGSWTLTPPAGWTTVSSILTQSGSLRNALFYKFAGGSEPSSYAFSTGSGNDGIINGGLFALRESEGRPLVWDSHADNGPGSGQNWTTPGCTQIKPGRVFHFRAGKHNTGTTPTYSTSGWTEMWDLRNDGGAVVYAQAMYIGFSDDEAVGAESGIQINSTVNVTNATSNIGRTFVVGYNPQVNVNAGSAAVSVAAYGPSVQSSGNFPAGHGAVAAAAYDAVGRVGPLAGSAAARVEMGLASTWSIVPTSDPQATAYNAVAAVGAEPEAPEALAMPSTAAGYYGAPRSRIARVTSEDRTYHILGPAE